MANVFIVGKSEHHINDRKCEECYSFGYPKNCSCGGLVHCEFIRQSWDLKELDLTRRCDKCGDEFEEVNIKPKFKERKYNRNFKKK